MHKIVNNEGRTVAGDPSLKEQQYINAGKFNARIQLNAQCATNKYPWPLWVFDRFEKKPQLKILELGCGTGLLWQVNGVRIPADWNITLSDFSEGMLKETKTKLRTLKFPFNYEVINAEQIPYPNNTFDAVIANHMLYHVDDLDWALSEISRVVKPGGILYATTVGERNMLEMRQLVREFCQNDNYETATGAYIHNFSLNNGLGFLRKYFHEIRIARYENMLRIKDAELLTEYILSCNGLKPGVEVLAPAQAEVFRIYARDLIQSREQIEICTDSGMFICYK